jgi:hypothetical protein
MRGLPCDPTGILSAAGLVIALVTCCTVQRRSKRVRSKVATFDYWK